MATLVITPTTAVAVIMRVFSQVSLTSPPVAIKNRDERSLPPTIVTILNITTTVILIVQV